MQAIYSDIFRLTFFSVSQLLAADPILIRARSLFCTEYDINDFLCLPNKNHKTQRELFLKI